MSYVCRSFIQTRHCPDLLLIGSEPYYVLISKRVNNLIKTGVTTVFVASSSWRRSSFCGVIAEAAREHVLHCRWKSWWCSQTVGGPWPRYVHVASATCTSLTSLNVFPSFQGIIVDGHLTGAPPKRGVEERSRTYFDRLTISTDAGGPGDVTITLSLDAVVVEGEGRDMLPINQQGWVRRQGVIVTVDNHRSCWVEMTKDIQFLVLFHAYQHPTYLQKAHLGFYIVDGRGLSASTQGLLGTPSCCLCWCVCGNNTSCKCVWCSL